MSESPAAERLRNLLSVTDSSLSRLDVEDLEEELLDRLRTILDVDTAAILLRDEGSEFLIADAARGLEEEVRQGVRVPIGSGFAGSIAERRRPVVLDRVDASTVTNPILWAMGIQKMLGVPLLSGDDVIGVLHVGRLDDRPFGEQDAQLLQVAAERIAGAIQARRLAAETAAADLLERSMLPPRLPRPPGMELAARYAPSERRLIGGDWYDAFTLPSGDLWLVAGDVGGHGLRAAVVMGQVKTALRSYALHVGEQERVLQLTDRMMEHAGLGVLVTVACAVSRPPYDEIHICLAGHPPPVRATPGEPAELVDARPGPPLGIGHADARRAPTSVTLALGDVLLLYTDGLVERRDSTIDEGLQRLVDATTATHPEALCRVLMQRMIGGYVPSDDIALLAARRVAVPLD
ncbi:MAG TPA: GAF domain-containing SpoIIE family protein phosphatase [Jatrophihabitans sp.]|nr:GAF domain-containing SpoIIE family protein phosphatase [Jatrophihabitans sp.]